MSDLPGRSARDLSDSSTPSARTTLRHVGEYLLVAQLGDDALGSVYRALHADGRFVRLRVLQSPELPPREVLEIAGRQTDRRAALGSDETTHSSELYLADGIPYLVWPETNGWTLDFILARGRAGGWGMPVEFALLIAERATAQLEQARLSAAPGEAGFHGVLWPGFVSISSDAEVQVEGFGLADIALPCLAKPRMWRDVAPYIAPEARETGRSDEGSDVYSIGVLLAELLTGQRASADMPPPCWRADDDFSQEVSLLLRFALGHPPERFSSMAQLHESLKELIESCPFETSPADLALFLYELLNPESRILPTTFDGSSTNPVSADRRLKSLGPRPRPALMDLPSPSAPDIATVVAQQSVETSRNALVICGAPALQSVSLARWTTRAAAMAASIAALCLLDPLVRNQTVRFVKTLDGNPVQSQITFRMPPPPAVSAGSSEAASVAPLPRFTQAVGSPRLLRASTGRVPLASSRRQSEARSAAERLRLKAALARIEAERLDAAVHAAGAFRGGRSAEQEGEQLLARRQYSPAREAYAHALDLFTEAESASREERVRQIQILGEGAH